MIYAVFFYMLGGAGFLPSTAGFLNHQQESCEARIQSPPISSKGFFLGSGKSNDTCRSLFLIRETDVIYDVVISGCSTCDHVKCKSWRLETVVTSKVT